MEHAASRIEDVPAWVNASPETRWAWENNLAWRVHACSTTHEDYQQVLERDAERLYENAYLFHHGVTTGDHLRGWRSRLGISQAELGERLGLPQNTIARWETGRIAIEHPKMLYRAMRDIERG